MSPHGHNDEPPERLRLSEEGAVTRSEEELRVDTRWRPSGRVRLVRFLESEPRTAQVELRREQVRIEHLPPAEASGSDQAEPVLVDEDGERWLVLYEEQVQTRWVPYERVRLRTTTVTEQQDISGEVRREQIEITDTSTGADR